MQCSSVRGMGQYRHPVLNVRIRAATYFLDIAECAEVKQSAGI